MKRLIGFIILALLTTVSGAQESFTEYSWTFADIAFRYPASWGEPVQRFETETGRVNMLLAESLVDSPDTRADDVPFVTISLLREVTEETDIYNELENDLEAVGINPIGDLPSSLFSRQSIATRGTSNDGTLFGVGQAIELEDERGILIIYGRTSIEDRDNFVAVFNGISNSLNLSASSGTVPPAYGVLWHQSYSDLDSNNSFLDFGGLALAPDGFLYAVDAFAGVLKINAETGLVESQTVLGEFTLPTDIAIASDNTIYVSDLACNCVHVVVGNSVVDQIEGFSIEAPVSIAVANDILYATDIVDDVVVVKALGEAELEILFDPQSFEQPLLAVDRSDTIIALVDNTIIYALNNDVLVEQYQLSSNILPTALAFDSNNNLIVATQGDGVLVFDGAGNEINQVADPTIDIPLAGESLFPQGIAASVNDEIYWVDSDGSFGNITAMSLGVEAGRIGSTNLSSGNVVKGLLSENILAQVWTFDGVSGDIITLTAIADFFTPELDLSLRLLAPDGREIAFNNDNESFDLLNPVDPQIDNFTLNHDGQYIVIVDAVFGIGRYDLGLSISETVDVSSGNVTLNGEVSETIPVQRWIFDGRGGQAIEITMLSTNFELDPYLILLSQNGNIVAENDDALDVSLGFDAQINDLNLPFTGRYIIEARRFDGDGTYELSINLGE